MSLINSDSILLFWDFHDQWHIFSLSEKKKVIVSHRIGHVTDFLFITNCIEFFSFLFPISFLISLLSVLRLANQYVMFREGSKWTKKVYKFFSFHCNQLWLSIDEIACTVNYRPYLVRPDGWTESSVKNNNFGICFSVCNFWVCLFTLYGIKFSQVLKKSKLLSMGGANWKYKWRVIFFINYLRKNLSQKI